MGDGRLVLAAVDAAPSARVTRETLVARNSAKPVERQSQSVVRAGLSTVPFCLTESLLCDLESDD